MAVLANITTSREASGKLECTQGLLRNSLNPEEILYNGYYVKRDGKDHPPTPRSDTSNDMDSKGNTYDESRGNQNSIQYLSLLILPAVPLILFN